MKTDLRIVFEGADVYFNDVETFKENVANALCGRGLAYTILKNNNNDTIQFKLICESLTVAVEVFNTVSTVKRIDEMVFKSVSYDSYADETKR